MEPRDFWSIGDYAVAGDLWSAPGRDLVASMEVDGRDVIDLATGTGVTAIAAGQAGASSVIGVDVTPELLDVAARRATAAGVDVEWVEADMQDVPLPDRSADLVLSTFGLVFAAESQRGLAEARRLTRPGGCVVFTSWSGTGLFGRVRRAMAEFFPDAPTPWHESPGGIVEVAGRQATVEERVFEMSVDSPQAFVSVLEQHSAPIILAARALGERWRLARAELLDAVAADGVRVTGPSRMPVTYLVSTIRV